MADIKITSPDKKQIMVRKVHDIQEELYEMLPPDTNVIRETIHDRKWEDAESLISDYMNTLHWKIQSLKESRKMIKRIISQNKGLL